MKVERLFGIVMVLLNKERATAKELSELFEVSVRTIQRDMDAINMAGIPIVAYQGYNGGYGILESYKIRENFFTDVEYKVLLTSLQAVYKAYEDQSMRNIIEKFTALIPNAANKQMDSVIMDFSPWGSSSSSREKMAILRKAVEEQRSVSFDYIDINGNISTREVEPTKLILRVSTWYLYAYCRLRKDYRLFKLSRIKNLNVLEQYFIPREMKELPDFEHSNKVEKVKLKLKFHPSAFNRLEDYFDLEDLEYKEDGFVYVFVEYPEDQWVYSMILSFGDRIEVIEPKDIRKVIEKNAKNIISQYRSEEL